MQWEDSQSARYATSATLKAEIVVGAVPSLDTQNMAVDVSLLVTVRTPRVIVPAAGRVSKAARSS